MFIEESHKGVIVSDYIVCYICFFSFEEHTERDAGTENIVK